jgi:hypothetical protein
MLTSQRSVTEEAAEEAGSEAGEGVEIKQNIHTSFTKAKS